jgi:hypothetical protein
MIRASVRRAMSLLSRTLVVLAVSSVACAPATLAPGPEAEDTTAAGEGITGSMIVGSELRATGDVYLRSEPDKSATILHVVTMGSLVHVVASDPVAGFYQVDHDGVVGWSSGKYYEPTGDTSTATGGASSSGGSGGASSSGAGGGTATSTIWSPAPGTSWQWQLSGSLDTSVDVEMYDIDLFDTPASTIASLKSLGRRVICYFSAGSRENWRPDAAQFEASDHGNPLDDWVGETWLDTRSSNVRAIMKSRLDLAVSRGCDGVEPDNVDAYANDSGFPLTAQTQLDYDGFLATESHARGLSVGLKNAGDLAASLQPSFDWALNEQCLEYAECQALQVFVSAGKAVFHVEYASSSAQGAAKKAGVCGKPSINGFSTLIKTLDLGAWALACP